MRIFVTNDDGIDGVGLHQLARALTPLGDVVIGAPDREYSGAGAALGTLHLLHPEVHRETVDGVPEAWAINGPPALCVLFARLGAFGDPFDLVVSGINPGVNAGRSIYHSGTVGAALTARNGGISGIAVSQAVDGFGVEGQGDPAADQHWDTAAEIAAVVAKSLLDDLPTDPVVVNINVPNTPIDDIAGWRRTVVGSLPPRTIASASLEPKLGHDDTYTVVMDWGDRVELPADQDGGAVEAGYVSVNYLSRMVDEDHDELLNTEVALDTLFDDQA